MNRFRLNTNHLLIYVFFIFGLFSCTFPFTTATYKWKIKWDKDKLKFKDKFVGQKLEAYSKGKPPNILFIVVDDLGKYEVSSYGSETVETPNIDQLASEGVRFKDCYVSSPVCSPSRAGMMSGRYPPRFGFETQPMEIYPNNLAVYALGKYMVNTGDFVLDTKPKFPPEWQIQKQGLPPTEFTLAEILKMRNYNTASIGKWHLGYSKELIPNNRGFDYQYGFYGAFSLYSEKRTSPDMVNFIQSSFSAKHQWKVGRKETSAILRNNKKIKEERYLTWAILDEGIDYISKHKDDQDPFVLYLAFNAVHVPFQAPKEYYDNVKGVTDENKRVYYAMIHTVDDAIGKLMKSVKDMGLEEDTLIYFISDNGGASYTGATDNGPFKGGKLTMFEGGVNVPFIMKWKGHIPEGLVYENPVSSMDIFMTSAKVAECPLPEDRIYDGIDLLPYLKNEKKEIPHAVFYWKADHIEAMRKGNWKFLLSTRDKWIELYNISKDKYEHYDLNDVHPDTLKLLRNEFDSWKKNLKEPLWPRLMDHKFTIDGKDYLFPA
jgi:arylsulfatase A-like enzyme